MRAGAIRGDLALLRSGLSLGWAFGAGSLEELARTALELENGIYRAGGLTASGGRVRLTLQNPPLRIGAFRSVAAYWDGVPLLGTSGWVATERAPELRPLASVTDAVPLLLETGEGSRFELAPVPEPTLGPHRVRLEWRSRAVPPLVWMEIADHLRAAEDA